MRIKIMTIAMTVLLVVALVEVGICSTLELIISDSGRNQSWSSQLRVGDAFSVKSADDKPVGGIMAGTSAI